MGKACRRIQFPQNFVFPYQFVGLQAGFEIQSVIGSSATNLHSAAFGGQHALLSDAKLPAGDRIVVANLIESIVNLSQAPTVPGVPAMANGPGHDSFAAALQIASSQALIALKTVPQIAAGRFLATDQLPSAPRLTEKNRGPVSTPAVKAPANPLMTPTTLGNLLTATPAALPMVATSSTGNCGGVESKDQLFDLAADSPFDNSLPTESKMNPASLANTAKTFVSTPPQTPGLGVVPGMTRTLGAIPKVSALESEASPDAASLPRVLQPENPTDALASQETSGSNQASATQASQNVGGAETPTFMDGQMPPPSSLLSSTPVQFAVPDTLVLDTLGRGNDESRLTTASGPEFVASSQMPPECAMPALESPAVAGRPHVVDQNDLQPSAARPATRVVPRISNGLPIFRSSTKPDLTVEPQVEGSISAGKTGVQQNLTSLSSVFAHDGSQAALLHPQREISSTPRNSAADDSTKISHQPLVNQESPDSPSTVANATTANPQPVIGSEPASPPKTPVGDAESSSSASSVIASVPLASGRGPENQDLRTSEESSSPARPLPTPEAATGVVQVARVVDGMSRSEMHLDMRTQDFGSVEVHTVLRESQLGLSVGSEKGDLRGFLMPEVPSLQAVIHQQDLRFDAVRFLEHNSQSSAAFSGSANSHSHAQNRGQSQSPENEGAQEGTEGPSLQEIPTLSTMGLSVHA